MNSAVAITLVNIIVNFEICYFNTQEFEDKIFVSVVNFVCVTGVTLDLCFSAVSKAVIDPT